MPPLHLCKVQRCHVQLHATDDSRVLLRGFFKTVLLCGVHVSDMDIKKKQTWTASFVRNCHYISRSIQPWAAARHQVEASTARSWGCAQEVNSRQNGCKEKERKTHSASDSYETLLLPLQGTHKHPTRVNPNL